MDMRVLENVECSCGRVKARGINHTVYWFGKNESSMEPKLVPWDHTFVNVVDCARRRVLYPNSSEYEHAYMAACPMDDTILCGECWHHHFKTFHPQILADFRVPNPQNQMSWRRRPWPSETHHHGKLLIRSKNRPRRPLPKVVEPGFEGTWCEPGKFRLRADYWIAPVYRRCMLCLVSMPQGEVKVSNSMAYRFLSLTIRNERCENCIRFFNSNTVCEYISHEFLSHSPSFRYICHKVPESILIRHTQPLEMNSVWDFERVYSEISTVLDVEMPVLINDPPLYIYLTSEEEKKINKMQVSKRERKRLQKQLLQEKTVREVKSVHNKPRFTLSPNMLRHWQEQIRQHVKTTRSIPPGVTLLDMIDRRLTYFTSHNIPLVLAALIAEYIWSSMSALLQLKSAYYCTE